MKREKLDGTEVWQGNGIPPKPLPPPNIDLRTGLQIPRNGSDRLKVILRERVELLGDVGEVIDVKPGYGRNYLIPRGLAYEATEANKQRLQAEAARVAAREAETLGEARERAAAIEGLPLTFHARASGEGKLFGSITSADIAERLAEQGISVDRRQIELDEPIKSLGVTSVPVRLHPQVHPEVKVWVIQAE